MKRRGTSITLIILALVAGIFFSSQAQKIESASQEILWIDGNNCGPDGPQAAWLCYRIINDTGGELTDVTISFEGFINGDTHIFKNPSDPERTYSQIESNDTVPVYFYIDYSAVCDYPSGGGNCVYGGYSAEFIISVKSDQNGTIIEKRTLQTECLLSASAAGQVVSLNFGPGIWVGQLLSQVVEYSFGNNIDLFFQPIGDSGFPDHAYRLVASRIIDVSGNISTDVKGMKDALHFPDLEVPGNGGTITVEYFWEVISLYETIFIHPWACAKSGNKYKFSGFGEGFPMGGINQGAAIAKTVDPPYFESIDFDAGYGSGIARWTITLYNQHAEAELVIDTIRDMVPSCMTITNALVDESDITLSMTAAIPNTGATNEVKWVGQKQGDPEAFEFRVLPNDSIKLIYLTDISTCPYPASYTNFASASLGSTTIGPAQATVGINCKPPIFDIPQDAEACNAYTLPAISGMNLTGEQAYFDNSQANGGQPITGPLTNSMRVWLFDAIDENPACADEESFEVTIYQGPEFINPGDQVACDNFILPQISGTHLSGTQDYYDNNQANGGQPITGPISESRTIWIYDVNTDNSACETESSFDVTIHQSPELSYESQDIPCFGVQTGWIELTVTSGEEPFDYEWTTLGGEGLINGLKDQHGLGAGEYYVTATDANGCADELIITLGQPESAIAISNALNHVLCDGPGGGSIQVAVEGGTGNYTLNWSGPDDFSSHASTITGLSTGLYQLNVIDGNGCEAASGYEILEGCLSVKKVLDPPGQNYSLPGETLNYRIEMTNTGTLDIYEPTLSDPFLDEPLTLLTGDQNYNGMLDEGENWVFTGSYAVKQEDIDRGHFTNIVEASGKVDLSGDGLYETLLTDEDQANAEAVQQPKISLLKQLVLPLADTNNDGVPGYLGDLVQYKFSIYNSGNVTLYDIAVADPVAAVSGQPLAELGPGELDLDSYSAGIEITQAHLDAGIIINSAEVTASKLPGADKEVYDISDDPSDQEDEDLNGDGDPDDPTELALYGSASVGDLVWLDANGDGVQNNAETGIGGIQVELFELNKGLVESKTTDGAGHFVFEDVKPGTYFLKFKLNGDHFEFTTYQSGYDLAMDSDVNNNNGPGTTPWISIGPAQSSMDIDAGVYTCVTFTGMNWCDYNRNSICENTENGINGMRVSLYKKHNGDWIYWDSVITRHSPGPGGNDGYFSFCTLPGEYYLHFQLPPFGLTFVHPFMGEVGQSSSHVDHSNGLGTTKSFTLLCTQQGNGSCKIVYSGYMHDQTSE
jgi:hypothetical protein